MLRRLRPVAVVYGVCWLVGAAGLGAVERADLIIQNALVLTMNAEADEHENGSVVVRDGEIVAVGGAVSEDWEADTVIDAGGDIVMPGMMNLHNHIPMVAFRGLGENGVGNRLFEFFFPLEKEMLSRDLIRIASRHGAIEMALAGVTLVTDMYYHEDEVARGVAEVGIRGVLGETVIGFPVVDAPEPWGGLAYAEEFIREWKDHPLITPAIAPHAPYTVPPDWLRKTRALAEREGVPILLHTAEFAHETRLVRENYQTLREGQSTVEYLEEVGFLCDSLVAAHAIYVDEEDMETLKRHGVGVAHNPKANSRGATGMSPAWEMFHRGIDIGLGTDGPMSSNQMDVLNVMNQAAGIARLRGSDGTRFTPYELVSMATIGGARALDREHELGSIEVGKKADLVIVDVHAPNMQPLYDPYANIVFSAYPQDVRTTVVDGRIVVLDRVLQTVDLEKHWEEWKPLTDRVAEFAKTLGKGNESFTNRQVEDEGEAAAPVAARVNVDEDGLALQGYDPVAYFTEGSARQGSVEHSLLHEGASYRFQSAENRAAFLKDPGSYLPDFGGWCAYGYGMDPKETGYAQGPYPVDPENFKIADGRLFLFFKQEGYDAREQWERDEGRFRARADAFWREGAEGDETDR